MIQESRKVVSSIKMPVGAKGFRIVFAPTRTIVKNARYSIGDALGARDGGVDIPIENPYLPIVTSGPTEDNFAGATVHAVIHYLGEELSNPLWRWRYTDEDEEKPGLEYQIIYNTRYSACKLDDISGDGRQSFLFEVDRCTHSVFVFLSGEHGPAATSSEWVEALSRLAGQLGNRLRTRRDRPVLEPAPYDQTLIESISRDVFIRAAEKIHCEDKSTGMGEALLSFAEGALRWYVYYGDVPGYPVSSPDSAGLFLFAELGLLARQCDPGFWTIPLLLNLVKMQRYFLKRFRGPLRLEEYGQPNRPLDANDKRAIDLEYEERARTVTCEQDIERLIHQNVNLTNS